MFVFEGIDCIGKTTAINYIKDRLILNGVKVTVLNDWISDPLGKQRLLDAKTVEDQVRIVLECRRNTHKILHEVPDDTVVLFDRYILSTLVYQCFSFKTMKDTRPVLNISPELLDEVRKTQVPCTVVYIKPGENFDRYKFLKERAVKDKFDKKNHYWYNRLYWYVTMFPETLGLKLPEIYTVTNNGDDTFFTELDLLSDKIQGKQNVTANRNEQF